ncbi:MAG TPA: rhomboid family intramembrane serine protease [Stellaceae bacterium]|nr:rhomboid family intramembrane serine protease [Stellaceae bacterium]
MLALPLYDDTPTWRLPIATYGLIAACVLAFLWQHSLGYRAEQQVAYALGMIPAVLFGHAELPYRLQIVPPWATVVTSMFLHGGWLHLLGNMLFLWLFGRGVESALGTPRFLLFYLVCGVAAALAQAAMDPTAALPMIGASGAIAGILGAYLVLYPRGNIVVFIWVLFFVRLITVPAVILLGLWFLVQLLSALAATTGEPGVAFWAHVAGFLAGMFLIVIFRRPGTPLLQPRRSAAFAPRRYGGASVPPAGRPWRRSGPWG